jgi:hypothetical protein
MRYSYNMLYSSLNKAIVFRMRILPQKIGSCYIILVCGRSFSSLSNGTFNRCDNNAIVDLLLYLIRGLQIGLCFIRSMPFS